MVVCLCVALCAHVRLYEIGIGSCHLLPAFLSTKDANNNSHNENKYIQIYIYIYIYIFVYTYLFQLQPIVIMGEEERRIAVLFAVPTF